MLTYRQKHQSIGSTGGSVADLVSEDDKTPYGIPIFELKRDYQRQNEQNSESIEKLEPPKKKRKRGPKQLLSEKYRAQNYMDLLGNAEGNKHALSWVNQWFCSRHPKPQPGVEPVKYTRPEKKILLIHGPAGTGKTTAAHVIAKQRGYKVLEINASDDRTKMVVSSRIAPLVRTQQATSALPACVVLDEIDGAAEFGLVRGLIDLVREDQRAQWQIEHPPKKKEKRAQKILRPIIAVCNDAYVPALRDLRQYCEIVKFQKPLPQQILARLKLICQAENIKVSQQELSRLVANCDYDLRSTLNALQFHNQNLNKNQAMERGLLSSELVEKLFDVEKIPSFSDLESCVDPERLLDSCFGAYLKSNFVDNRLSQPSNFADFAFLGSLPFLSPEMCGLVAHAFGSYFRAARPLKLTFQDRAQDIQFRSKLRECKRVTNHSISRITSQSGSETRRVFTPRLLVSELLPFATNLSKPTGLTNDHKKLEAIARACEEVGIKFHLETIDGVRTWRLDPPLDDLSSCFNGKMTNEPQISSLRGKIGSYKPLETIALKPDLMETQEDVDSSKQWIQYSEGFSNAVRKPISWNALFPPQAKE